MKRLVILPRGGLGDVLYHVLFARYVHSCTSDFEPVLIAPRYAAFLANLLDVRHIPARSMLTDGSAGVSFRGELEFCRALSKLRGNCMASFTNDIVDHGLARCFHLSLFDQGTLGNWLHPFNTASRLLSREGVNRLVRYQPSTAVSNPKHLLDRQRQALQLIGLGGNLAEGYRDIWKNAVAGIQGPRGFSRLLFFPETAQTAKNLTLNQMEYMITRLQSQYRICIFTRYPERYRNFGAETAGFDDRLYPIKQILSAGAVISADTFSAHLAGITGTPTYVIYNCPVQPAWCQHWGSPYSNVYNFEGSMSYQLDAQFHAFPSREDGQLFGTVQKASEQSLRAETHPPSAATLSGSAARS